MVRNVPPQFCHRLNNLLSSLKFQCETGRKVFSSAPKKRRRVSSEWCGFRLAPLSEQSLQSGSKLAQPNFFFSKAEFPDLSSSWVLA